MVNEHSSKPRCRKQPRTRSSTPSTLFRRNSSTDFIWLFLHHVSIRLAWRHERPDIFLGIDRNMHEQWSFVIQNFLDTGDDFAVVFDFDCGYPKRFGQFDEVRIVIEVDFRIPLFKK